MRGKFLIKHTSKDWLSSSPGNFEGQCYFRTLYLPYSRVPISPGGELLHISGASEFVAATQEMNNDFLVMVASGVWIHGWHGTVTKKEKILSRLPPTGYSTTADWNIPSVFLLKRPICWVWIFVEPKGQASGFEHIPSFYEILDGDRGW